MNYFYQVLILNQMSEMRRKESLEYWRMHIYHLNLCPCGYRRFHTEQYPWIYSNCRALVFVCHGFAEHYGWYESLADTLTKAGFLVFSHDHGKVLFLYCKNN